MLRQVVGGAVSTGVRGEAGVKGVEKTRWTGVREGRRWERGSRAWRRQLKQVCGRMGNVAALRDGLRLPIVLASQPMWSQHPALETPEEGDT